MTLPEIQNIATVIGIVVGCVALVFTALQYKKSADIAAAQFWLTLEEMFAKHDDVHILLRGGAWSTPESGPETVEEWAMLEDYMGLFEHCELLIAKGLIDEKTFQKIFRYRIENILENRLIARAKLVEEKSCWETFIDLVKRMKLSDLLPDEEQLT